MGLLIKKLFIYFLIGCVPGLFLSCGTAYSKKTQPIAENGVIDLAGWDFEKDGPVTLEGEWKFRWYGTEDNPIHTEPDDTDDRFLRVPSFWQKKLLDWGYKKSFNAEGLGELYLEIKNLSDFRELALYLRSCYLSYELYVDGLLLMSRGKPRLSKSEYIPHILPGIKVFPSFLFKKDNKNKIETNDLSRNIIVTWKIAAYDFNLGGPETAPQIGQYNQLMEIKWFQDFTLIFVLGIIFIMALYHFSLWLKRKEDKSSFYFSILCLCIALFYSINKWILPQIFPHVISAIIYRISYVLIFLIINICLIAALSFFRVIFPDEFSPKLKSAFIWFALILSAITIIFSLNNVKPITSNPLLLYVTFGGMILGAGWSLYGCIKAVKNGRKQAHISLIGVSLFVFTIIHDIIFSFRIFQTGHIAPFGVVVLIFSYSLVIAHRNADAYKTANYLSQNLQEEVKKQTRELEETNQKLQLLDKQKSQFFQNITHELRTPLTLILGPLESLINQTQDKLPPHSISHLTIMHRNAIKLLDLINQILNMSRLVAGKEKLHVNRGNLVPFLEQIVASFQSYASNKKINFNFQTQKLRLEGFFDKTKLERIIFNLLNNAFKFTPPGGSITLRLHQMNPTDNHARIDVEDTGIGIPKDQLSSVFDRFHQVDESSTREYEGTGIGLSLVMDYIQLHHGSVDVKSESGRGSLFTISFPLEKEAYAEDEFIENEKETAPPPDISLKMKNPEIIDSGKLSEENFNIIRQTILLVEDNPDMLQYLSINLEKDYNCFTAINGEDGLSKITKIPRPDLIITDLMMPRLDGFRFCELLQADPDFMDIPIIILTAKSDLQSKLTGLAAGAVDYIYKPFSARELQLKVNSHLENQQLKQALYEKDKLATIGMLFAGISHEILNPLGGISAPLENIKKRLRKISAQPDDRILKNLDVISSSVDRISELIKSFRTIFYRNNAEVAAVDIGTVIESSLLIFRNKLKQGIEVETNIPDGLIIKVDQNALSHILINIIVNAIDAMAGKGALRIDVIAHEENVRIIVRDNGCGIASTDLKNIYKPFFTTKKPGQGTGLGLYFVKTLVNRIGWTIDIESEIGIGTRVLLTKGEVK